MKLLAMTALAMMTSGTTMAFDEYRIDDGVPEQNIGIAGGGTGDRQIAWLNKFVVQPGDEIITGMRVAFGNVPNGEFATGFLWYDSNQDGNPDDAFFITFASELVVNATPVNPAGWTYFDFPDTPLIPGDIIYAGCVMDISPNEQPARIDFDGNDQPVITYPPNNHSYIVGDTINPIAPNDMDMAQLPITRVANALGVDGTWLIRLDAAPINPPCPADINGDGVVDASDLARLLAGWNNAAVDLDGDGITSASDLAIMLAAWGPCP